MNGLSDGRCVVNDHGARGALPIQVHLELGGKTQYTVLGGVLRTLVESLRVHGDCSSPFAYVALLNRYYSEVAQLTVRGLGDAALDAFASATDLGTGLERPVALERGSSADEIFVRTLRCPPRTLLRIYWRLDRTLPSP